VILFLFSFFLKKKKKAKKRTFGFGTLRKMLEKESGAENEDTIMQNVQEIRKWAPVRLFCCITKQNNKTIIQTKINIDTIGR